MKGVVCLLLVAGAVYAQYAAAVLGNVGYTTVSGVQKSGEFGPNQEIPAGAHIYGPLEAGFSSMQDGILATLGCTTGKGYVDGGIDTYIAEQVVGADCGVQLPRWEGETYVGLVGSCGGHTPDYHFHERLICLYKQEGKHSTQVGEALDGKGIYGKWENYEAQERPMLDACGGHWGPTDETGELSYHYHVQDRAPFTVGCYGPNPDNSLVTVQQCRALYSGCGDGDEKTLTFADGKKMQYDPWCPCYDEEGNNVNPKERAVFSDPEKAKGPEGMDSALTEPTSATTTKSGNAAFGTGTKKSSKKGKKAKMSTSNVFGTFRIAEEVGEVNCYILGTGEPCNPNQRRLLFGGAKMEANKCVCEGRMHG
jgi:hypothetical protein